MARILLADDDAAMLDLVCRALTADGHTVTAATDGQEALDRSMTTAEPFDVLVTDLQMPGLDGITLAERLITANIGLRVVLMSGFQGDLARADQLKHNGARFIAKPFTLEQIRAEIRLALS